MSLVTATLEVSKAELAILLEGRCPVHVDDSCPAAMCCIQLIETAHPRSYRPRVYVEITHPSVEAWVEDRYLRTPRRVGAAHSAGLPRPTAQPWPPCSASTAELLWALACSKPHELLALFSHESIRGPLTRWVADGCPDASPPPPSAVELAPPSEDI